MSDYSLCDFSLRQLKEIAKKRKIPITKKTKCELIILLERDGYIAPSKRTRFKKQQERMEYESDDIDDKLKYNLCLDRRNKLYSKSNEELKQKIKKRNPNFIIPPNLSQNKLIDELMYLDECNDLLPKNFSSKLEFIPEKIYMKPVRDTEMIVKPKKTKIIKKTESPFWNDRMEAMRLERLPVRDLLDILYSKPYFPMELISKLKTKEQLIDAIMSSDPSNISSIVLKL